MTSESDSSPSYSSDAPLQSADEDRFHRWPFAERVAQVLRSRRDVDSLVVGLYGTWGEGKTTTLNYIEQALQDDPDVAVVQFNPWRFGEEAVLIRQFFEALAEAVGGKLTTKKEDFAAAVENYSSALSIGAFGARFNRRK